MLPIDILIPVALIKLPFGGKEGLIQNPERWIRDSRKESRPLYDTISTFKGNYRIELKTQQNLQWFDIGKFHELSAEDLAVELLFLMHSGEEKLESVWNIRFDNLLDLALADSECVKGGWTVDAIKRSAELKKDYPRVQLKAPLYIRAFRERHLNSFQILWMSE